MTMTGRELHHRDAQFSSRLPAKDGLAGGGSFVDGLPRFACVSVRQAPQSFPRAAFDRRQGGERCCAQEGTACFSGCGAPPDLLAAFGDDLEEPPESFLPMKSGSVYNAPDASRTRFAA